MVLDTPILNKAYDLYKLLSHLRKLVPKAERYTLWFKCEEASLAILESLVATAHQQGDERTKSLYKISDKIDLLKIFFRLAKENQVISLDKYLEIQKLLQEMGKMVGGWIKFVPK